MEYSKKSTALKNIRDLCRKGKIVQARKYMEEYKDLYEEDAASVFADAKVTFYEGKMEEAGRLLEQTIELSSEQLLEYSKLNYVYYLLEIKEYQEAYNILNSINTNELLQKDKETYVRIILCKTFIEKELELLPPTHKLNIYFYNQIIDYSTKSALEHIYLRHNGKVENLKGRSTFKMEYDALRTHFFKTSEIIKHSTKNASLDLVDHYYFRKDGVGVTSEKKPTDIFTAITLKHTNQIITMYPIDAVEFPRKTTNAFEMYEETYTSPKKRVRKSQIDKFNSKYNLK